MTTNGQSHDHPGPRAAQAGTGEQGDHPEAPAAVTTLGIVPEAEPLAAEDLSPNPEGPGLPPGLPAGSGQLPPFPFPFPKPCKINLKAGCYRITYRPSLFVTYRGTMRVEASGAQKIVSGDLYRFTSFPFPQPFPGPLPKDPGDEGTGNATALSGPLTAGKLAELVGTGSLGVLSPGIPIYPRNKYYSYLKVTGVQQSPPFSFGGCNLTLTAQEYQYAQPPAGTFNGTFPASPGTRTVKIVLGPKSPAPIGSPGPYFEGRLTEAGVDKGEFTMGWVSPYFRKATVEIDTLNGAVAPAAVGADDFRTVFATAGWDLTVSYDQVNVPVPAGVVASDCWASGKLHDLMTTVRNPATDLDKEWRMHLVVVPAQLGCGRGVMYDTIVVPREGVASFCDDGYPSTDTTFYGAAADKKQRNVPRAFLRSASHELGHGFNQVHQEGEGGADNSIMTTTPGVAGVLKDATTGAPGIFPDDINLGFNDHCRRHLAHWPDPLVRPGGHTFGSGHSGPAVPSPDRQYFTPDELELRLEMASSPIEIGEPLRLSWALTNTSQAALPVPNDISVEAQQAVVSVTGPTGVERVMRSFVILTDAVSIQPLPPGESLRAETRVFWSAEGFAFEMPGRYRLDIEIAWVMQGGIAFGVRGTTEVWVNFPQSQADNDAAALLLSEEVGKYVALGGDAAHLTDAVARLSQLSALDLDADTAGTKALRGFDGILPSPAEDIRHDPKPAGVRS